MHEQSRVYRMCFICVKNHMASCMNFRKLFAGVIYHCERILKVKCSRKINNYAGCFDFLIQNRISN